MTNEETIELLNDLLTKAYDAEQGYETAAERAKEDLRLVTFFQRQSSLRREMGHAIKQEIGRLGGEPDKGASVVAKAHQIWITMKGFVSGGDSEAILEECIRGEEATLEEYDEAIATIGLDTSVATLLIRQRGQVASALAEVQRKEAEVC